jgi:DMSO/TMAO reductase YedYZ molybdopterin-dependent catalytic subunit
MQDEPTAPDGGAGLDSVAAGSERVEHDAVEARVSEAAGDPSGPPRFTRRRLLILGGAAAAGVAATAAGIRVWGGSGSSSGGSGSPGASPSASGRTDFPVLSVEPPPDVPAEDWVLRLDGLVDHPLTVDRDTWAQLARSSVTADFHCVTGWSVDDVRWSGVAPSVLLDRAGLKPGAQSVVFRAYGHLGGEYSSSLPLKLVTAPDALLADTLDGVPLPPPHGGPLRLVIPTQLGYKNVKWVVRMEVTDVPVPGYWEQRGYPQNAPVPGG